MPSFKQVGVVKACHFKLKDLSAKSNIPISILVHMSVIDFMNSGRAAALERVTRSLADDQELRKTYLARLRTLEPDGLGPEPEDVIEDYL